jgi:hypothetical protein
MRIILNILGVLALFMGGVWFLQGTNIFPYPPGGFMNGQTKWIIYGAILFLVGVVLLIWANRSRRRPANPPA